MSMLDKKLSAISTGSHIRLTSSSGRVIDGVVVENNDGVISIKVESMATIGYDQIVMLEEDNLSTQNHLSNDDEKSKTDTKESCGDAKELSGEKAEKEVYKLTAGIEDVKKAMRAVTDKDIQRECNRAFGKFEAYKKGGGEDKYTEAIKIMRGIIDGNYLTYNEAANSMLAYMQLIHKDHVDAADSFFYAGNYRFAYIAAYQGIDEQDDDDEKKKLYILAAAFSAIYLLSDSTEEMNEAIEVLEKSSRLAEDISGLVYVLDQVSSSQIKDELWKVLQNIGRQFTSSSMDTLVRDQLLGLLAEKMSSKDIENKIREYNAKIPQYKKNKTEKQNDNEDSREDSGKSQGDAKTPQAAVIDTNTEYEGSIVSYNRFEEHGEVLFGDNKYRFELNSVEDQTLKEQLRNLQSNLSEGTAGINVKFKLVKYGINYEATSIRRNVSAKVTQKTQLTQTEVENRISEAHSLMREGKYERAIKTLKPLLEKECDESGVDFSAQIGDSFGNIIKCYNTLFNSTTDMNYLRLAGDFIESNISKIKKTKNALEVLKHYYMKPEIKDYRAALPVIDEICENHRRDSEHWKLFFYLKEKAKCYDLLQEYDDAIATMLEAIKLAEKENFENCNLPSDTYPYLASYYYKNGDRESAEYWVKQSNRTETIIDLEKKLQMNPTPIVNKTSEDEEEKPEDDEPIVEEQNLQQLYGKYSDDDGFEALGMDDKEIISKAFSFDKDHLYCLLTYLNCASAIASSSAKTRTDENGEAVDIGKAIDAVYKAASYAFNSPLTDFDYNYEDIIEVYNFALGSLPDIAPSLFAASALRALFDTPVELAGNYYFYKTTVESFNLNQYPTLIELIDELTKFYQLGYPMGVCAGQDTNENELDSIKDSATRLINRIETSFTNETTGRIKETRRLIFGRDSELENCLNAVIEGRVKDCQKVRNVVSRFMRSKSSDMVSYDPSDKKINDSIQSFWDKAAENLRLRGHCVSNPRGRLISTAYQNISGLLKEILKCLCEWISVVGRDDAGRQHVFNAYQEAAPGVKAKLGDIIERCNELLNQEFNWGTESIRLAAQELLSKLNGTYIEKARKYFFIDFLRGEDILLNDSYLPETQSTFCALPNFNILSRIENHSKRELPELSERLGEIFGSEAKNHNFRSAGLIRSYGEDMDIEEIMRHESLELYDECLKLEKERFDSQGEEFHGKLQLLESYGAIPQVDGDKDKKWAIAEIWHQISKATEDYGFYHRLIEALNDDIIAKAAEKAKNLKDMLNVIKSNPDYQFGAYDENYILEKIENLNFTAASYAMNSILEGDTEEIPDYSNEPVSYFTEFVEEFSSSCGYVDNVGVDPERNICNTVGSADLETALKTLFSQSADSEISGGVNLIKNWPLSESQTNVDMIKEFLVCIGFSDIDCADVDKSISNIEAYSVMCRKQSGKVSYIHTIPAFGSGSQTEGFRVLCIRDRHNVDALMDKFREADSALMHTIAIVNDILSMPDRRRLARIIKAEDSFSKTFIVIDRVVAFYLARHYAEDTVLKRLLAVTLPFAYYQPFVESSSHDMPPELFMGREAELNSIESPGEDNLVYVYGGRRLGKSALLEMAKRNIDGNEHGDRAVLIDVKGRSAQNALETVCNGLITEGILEEGCVCGTWDDLASNINNRLMSEESDKQINYLLLMLDEADEFVATCEDTDDQPIKALKQLPSDKFKLVMAGLYDLIRYKGEPLEENSTLLQLTPVTIKPFNRKEATMLLTSVLAYLGFKLSDDIIDSILASTYNYPGLIQYYCRKLIEVMKQDNYAGYKEANAPLYNVTQTHYKKVLLDNDFIDCVNSKFEATLFAEERGKSDYHIVALILAYLYFEKSDEYGYTKEDILAIAQDYEISRINSLNSEQLEEVLAEMRERNIITVMNDRYRFSTEGFRNCLGSREKVENEIVKYSEEDVQI